MPRGNLKRNANLRFVNDGLTFTHVLLKEVTKFLKPTFLSHKGLIDYDTNLIMQKALSVFLENGMFQKNIKKLGDLFQQNMIQSLVENRLMEAGFINIAEHYISYRLQRDLERNGYGDKVIVHLRFEQTK